MISPETALQMIQYQLKSEMQPGIYASYVSGTALASFEGDCYTILTPTVEAQRWLDSRLKTYFARQLAPLVGRPVQVAFTSPAEMQTPAEKDPKVPAPPVQVAPIEPEQAFSAVLAQAQAALPSFKDGFEAGEVVLRGYQDGIFRASAHRLSKHDPETARLVAFLQENLSRTLGRAVTVQFAAMPQAPQDELPVPSAPVEEPLPSAPDEVPALSPSESLIAEEVSSSVEIALQRQGRIVAFPRYELRHIPLVGPEAFFLRLAFLQASYLNSGPSECGKPFQVGVEALLRWANVGRATLHRFKKGDSSRAQQPAAGWFGIEQLPSEQRSRSARQQPPCRYRLQQGIPLTPMDADRLEKLLAEHPIQADPITALEALLELPIHELLEFPAPAPSEEQKNRAPTFTTVSGLVWQALAGVKLPGETRQKVQDLAAALADHITMPNQKVFVSWYFLQEWLPILGHDAAAMLIVARSRGYYNPQENELRDEVPFEGGYAELAQCAGLKRSRTVADWLPNLYERAPQRAGEGGESDKWQREQHRLQQVQAHIEKFVQVVPGSRKKMPAGHYAFKLHVEMQAEPLTPPDLALTHWVYRTLAACRDEQVTRHFFAWVTSPVIEQLAQTDGAGTLPSGDEDNAAQASAHMDGWGIEQVRERTARESSPPDSDGWEILSDILNDGWGILSAVGMTAGELFKGLLRLNTFWKELPFESSTPNTATQTGKSGGVTGTSWDLVRICQHNGGINAYREGILARETNAKALVSWLLYAYSFKGSGIKDPLGWAFTRLKERPGISAGGVFDVLAVLPPVELSTLLGRHIREGYAPTHADWRLAFGDAPIARLRALSEVLPPA